MSIIETIAENKKLARPLDVLSMDRKIQDPRSGVKGRLPPQANGDDIGVETRQLFTGALRKIRKIRKHDPIHPPFNFPQP